MCRFKLNFVVKAFEQESHENMQRLGSTGSRFRGFPSFVRLNSNLIAVSGFESPAITFFLSGPVDVRMVVAVVATVGGKEVVVNN